MKKNEIKKDPIRDFFISLISNVKENKNYYLIGFTVLVVAVPTIIILTSEKDYQEHRIFKSKVESLKSSFDADGVDVADFFDLPSDPHSTDRDFSYAPALKLAEDLSNILRVPESYADLNKNGKWDDAEDFIDSNKNGKWDNSLSLQDKIKQIGAIDVSNINNEPILSRFYQLYGSLLLDNGQAELAIEKYIEASKIYSDRGFYDASLNLDLSRAYFKKRDISNAETHINQAIECEFDNTDLRNNIFFLKGQILSAK